MREFNHSLLGICLLTLLTGYSNATLVVFIDNPGGFNTAVAGTGTTFQDTEDFEDSRLGADLVDSFGPGPFAPGVATPPNPGPGGFSHFPNGTKTTTGLTLTTSGGVFAVSSAFAFGTPSDQVGNFNSSDDLTLSFSLSGKTVDAVSFSPLFVDNSGGVADGSVFFDVFDSSGSQLVTNREVTGANYTNPLSVVGLVASGGMDIGSVVLRNANPDFIGVDNVSVYATAAIPEPSSFLFLGLLALGGAFAYHWEKVLRFFKG